MRHHEDDDNSTLEEKVESLQKALEAGRYNIESPALRVDNRMDAANKYLTEAAKTALAHKTDSQLYQYNEDVGNNNYVRKVAPCMFFTLRVRKDMVEEGVKEIANEINGLAARGAIKACLAPISTIDLAIVMYEAPSVAVFCFVCVPQEHTEYAQASKYVTLEGGLGVALGDLDVDLRPGEFLAECRLTHSLAMLEQKSSEARIHEVVNEYLRVLPEGTKYLGYREVAVIDLSMPYELKFYNPMLQNITRVSLDYVRSVAIIDEKLKQFNLFLGVRYFGKHPITGERNVDLYVTARQ